ncbi:pectinesterase inhibitor-like [Neltuma alba]|uniref:pectinesterase inhibitor-like n=1 Tax=Neltuma alba TaxID=207710 RepID=UPI0010A458A7|nr:pectinesterase inhibitor-like [Prosopis alba]XP_028797040.1 pectinesterase inhibitor-like [Prosopis alba]
MDFNGRLFFLTTLSSLLCINATPLNVIPSAVPLELGQLCKDTENPGLCIRTILPTLHGRLDPYQALVTEIDAAAHYTRRALGIIDRLMAQPNNPKSLSDSLSTCKEQYGNILDSIQTTLGVVAKKAMYDARVSLSAAISYQQTCEDTFKESGVDLPFARQSKHIFQLTGNCLDIMRALES